MILRTNKKKCRINLFHLKIGFQENRKILSFSNYLFYTQNITFYPIAPSIINGTPYILLAKKISRSWLRCVEDNCRRHVRVYISSRVPFFFFFFFFPNEKRRRGILRVSFRYYRAPVSSSYGWLELLCFTRPRRRAALSWRWRISPRRFCTRPRGTHGIVDSSQPLAPSFWYAIAPRKTIRGEPCYTECATANCYWNRLIWNLRNGFVEWKLLRTISKQIFF